MNAHLTPARHTVAYARLAGRHARTALRRYYDARAAARVAAGRSDRAAALAAAASAFTLGMTARAAYRHAARAYRAAGLPEHAAAYYANARVIGHRARRAWARA